MKTYVTTICERLDGLWVYNRTRVPDSDAQDVAIGVLVELIGEEEFHQCECLSFNDREVVLRPDFSFLNDFGEMCHIKVEQFGDYAQERVGMFII